MMPKAPAYGPPISSKKMVSGLSSAYKLQKNGSADFADGRDAKFPL